MPSSDFANTREFPSLPDEEQPHATVLADNAESIRNLSKRVIGDVIEIGRRLSECKKLLGHGNWLSWLAREFRWGERTARNFISAFEFAQSKSANVTLFVLCSPIGGFESSQFLLPSESVNDDGGEIIILWVPSQLHD
jgi:hypothetical protein